MKKYVTVGIRNQTFLEGYGVVDSYRIKIPGTDVMIKKALLVADGPPARTCYHIDDRKEVRNLTEKEMREGKYTADFFANLDKFYKDALEEIKKFGGTDISKSTNEELIEFFNKYYYLYLATIHPMVWAIYISDLQDLFEKELLKILNDGEKTQGKIIEFTALLLTPTRLTTVQKEEQLLFEIQNGFENIVSEKKLEVFNEFCEKEDIKEKLNQLVKLYGSFHQEYIRTAWETEDYKKHLWKRIKEFKEGDVDWKDLKSPNERLELIKKFQAEFFATHPCSDFFKNLVFAMQEFLIILDYTKADLVEGIYISRPLLTEIGKRTDSGDWIDVRYNTPDEIRKMLGDGTKANQHDIAERKAHRTILLENMEITIYQGDMAVEMANKLMWKESVDNYQEVKGTVAYPGKVKGMVKVITSVNEAKKIEQGNIMVTRDTTTELTSVIKKSAAIVADQGSLLSHTAIVAREFKIPCLILTQVGTKVFKDGDLVEVDADKGIVRKL